MTMQTDSAAGNFRLSMLISDTRYRSYTFQLVAMILLFASVGYLISNLIFNLQTAGLSISYEFLEEPAGYDINQRLIEYNSQIHTLESFSRWCFKYITCCCRWLFLCNNFWSLSGRFKIVQQLDRSQNHGGLCRNFS